MPRSFSVCLLPPSAWFRLPQPLQCLSTTINGSPHSPRTKYDKWKQKQCRTISRSFLLTIDTVDLPTPHHFFFHSTSDSYKLTVPPIYGTIWTPWTLHHHPQPFFCHYESLHLHKKDSFIHPGSAKKFSTCNEKIEHHVNYFTDSCDKCDKTLDGLQHE